MCAASYVEFRMEYRFRPVMPEPEDLLPLTALVLSACSAHAGNQATSTGETAGSTSTP